MNNIEKEYILCAAVWYKDFQVTMKPDKMPLLSYAPKNVDKGIVFCGQRHHQCIYQMVVITGKAQHEMGEEVQGFLTNINRFVDREEAYKIAIESGQIKEGKYHDNRLFSEDLY